ncbi:MAG: glycosyl hydrolase [Brevinematales bacterium]|jgi:beta-mannanase
MKFKLLWVLPLIITAWINAYSETKSVMFWGIFNDNAKFKLDDMDKMYGKKPAIVMWYIDWHTGFPGTYCELLNSKGYMPHIVWEAWYDGKLNSIRLADILGGKWDDYIRNWGKAAGEYGKPLMVRWGHEMNGNWYPWSGSQNGNSPETYIKAFQYVHDAVVRAGGTNVIWLWSPNCEGVPAGGWNEAKNYYPGSGYVDWVAVDGYNWGKSQSWSKWESFDEVFSKPLDEIQTYAPGKPIMIGEFGCSSAGGNKASWIKDFFISVKSKYPMLKAWIWFDISKETDWRFETDEESLAAFKAGITDEIYPANAAGLAGLK